MCFFSRAGELSFCRVVAGDGVLLLNLGDLDPALGCSGERLLLGGDLDLDRRLEGGDLDLPLSLNEFLEMERLRLASGG